MSEQPRPALAGVWKSSDRRDTARYVTVTMVQDGYAYGFGCDSQGKVHSGQTRIKVVAGGTALSRYHRPEPRP